MPDSTFPASSTENPGFQPAPEALTEWSEPAEDAVEEPPAADVSAPAEEHPSEAQTKRSGSSSAAANRSLIRRTAAKAQELSGAPDGQLELLGAVLGVSGDNLVDLTTAVMCSSGSKDTQSLGDALEILNADPLEAGITAASLGRHRLRQLWKLFGAMSVVNGDAPASDPKAAIALVRALHADAATTGRVQRQLEKLVSLLKK